jgi:hypothetical protein
MAGNSEARITTGTIGPVGTIRADGSMVRGEGGRANPRLVLPLEVRMSTRPKDSIVAVIKLAATLATAEHAPPASVVGSPSSCDLMDGFPCRSVDWGEMNHRIDLAFWLTPDQVGALERCRHAAPSQTFPLYLRLDGVVAGLLAYNELAPGAAATEDSPWEAGLGMYAQLFPFWQTRIDQLRVEIDTSRWVRDVLPGLGLDQSRLIEVTLPPPLPSGDNAAHEWDQARKAFDARRYRDCIERSRGVIRLWISALGATKERTVAMIIAERQQWPDGDPRRALLDSLWRTVTDFSNLPHHPETTGSEPFEAGPAEARLFLMLIATLSEYLGATW